MDKRQRLESLERKFEQLEAQKRKVVFMEDLIKKLARAHYDIEKTLLPLHIGVLRSRVNHDLKKEREKSRER